MTENFPEIITRHHFYHPNKFRLYGFRVRVNVSNFIYETLFSVLCKSLSPSTQLALQPLVVADAVYKTQLDGCQ